MSRKSQKPRRTRQTRSIARSISWSLLGRRVLSYLVFDALLATVLLVLFMELSFAELPVRYTDNLTGLPLVAAVLRRAVASGEAFGLFGGGTDVLGAHLDLTLGGHAYTWPLKPFASVVAPLVALVAAGQAIGLLAGLTNTRRIRRKLASLDELAETAERYASASAADLNKLASLERAVEHADPSAPRVATGDADLAGIEGALNNLLRQMQEAKLQQMRFVNDASHELRTPIAVIQGYVNMLDRWGKTDEGVLEESIEALKGESEHMQRLVEQLLFLARGDSGRQALERARVNVAELAAEVADESAMIDASHAYELVWEGGAAEMLGDAAMVKQSMRIIVQNAAKYSPAGTRVAIAVVSEPGRVGYRVTDEGMGMTSSDAAHVFDRFWRADAARSERADGSGLGLSIAKWIVDAHNGQVDVLSREGVGTRFTVAFPR